MKQTSEKIMKQILLEQMEKEFSMAPSDREIARQHMFSRRFRKKMELLGTGKDPREIPGKRGVADRKIKRRNIRILAACIACFLVLGIALTAWTDLFSFHNEDEASGAADMEAAEETAKVFGSDEEGSGQTLTDSSASLEQDTASEEVRMVMLDGKLYVDTGEISQPGRCGVADFTLDSSVEHGEPEENYQTNFGTGYDGQWGMRENRIDICIDGAWYVFAYQENDLEDVSMVVTEATDTSAEIRIENDSDLYFWYADTYSLEYFNEETGSWEQIPETGEYSYHDLAYHVLAGESSRWQTDWTERYGSLEDGTYRIVKILYEGQEAGDDGAHTMMAEFTIGERE